MPSGWILKSSQVGIDPDELQDSQRVNNRFFGKSFEVGEEQQLLFSPYSTANKDEFFKILNEGESKLEELLKEVL